MRRCLWGPWNLPDDELLHSMVSSNTWEQKGRPACEQESICSWQWSSKAEAATESFNHAPCAGLALRAGTCIPMLWPPSFKGTPTTSGWEPSYNLPFPILTMKWKVASRGVLLLSLAEWTLNHFRFILPCWFSNLTMTLLFFSKIRPKCPYVLGHLKWPSERITTVVSTIMWHSIS